MSSTATSTARGSGAGTSASRSTRAYRPPISPPSLIFVRTRSAAPVPALVLLELHGDVLDAEAVRQGDAHLLERRAARARLPHHEVRRERLAATGDRPDVEIVH